MGPIVSKMLEVGRTIESRHFPYSQENRTYNTMDGPAYDCSSFVMTLCYYGALASGGRLSAGGLSGQATPSMGSALVGAGWKHFAFGSPPGGYKAGDVVVWNKAGTDGSGNNGHTEMISVDGGGALIGFGGGRGSGNQGSAQPNLYHCSWQDLYRCEDALIPQFWTASGSPPTGTSGLSSSVGSGTTGFTSQTNPPSGVTYF